MRELTQALPREVEGPLGQAGQHAPGRLVVARALDVVGEGVEAEVRHAQLLERLEVAARTLGGSRLWVFASITLPLALPGIITGTLLSFARGLGEFGATITFVSNIPGETQTISSAIYSLIQTPDGDTAAARLVLISIVIAMGALIASEWFARRATKRLHGN